MLEEEALPEESMGSTEAHCRSIVDHLRDPVLCWNREAVITFANEAALSLFHHVPGRIVGKWVRDLHPPEHRTQAEAYVRDLLAHPRVSLREILIQTASGPCWYQWRDVPIPGPAGELVEFQSIGRDITSHKTLEADLAESEERYRTIFETSQVPMFLVDPEARLVLDANQAAESFYGIPRAEFQKGKPLSEINQLSPEQLQAAIGKAAEERQNQFLFQHRIASGEIRDVEVFSGPLRIKGRLLLYSIIHDVSERTRAEEALRRSEAKYRLVAEELNEGLGVTDASNRYVYCNPAFVRMLGYPPEELAGMTPLDLIFDEDAASIRARLAQRRLGQGERYEQRLRRKDGSAMEALLSVTPLCGSDGEFLGIVGLVTDLTQARRNTELQSRAQKLESLSVMAGGVAHDFNNLFQSIQGQLEMAMRCLTDPSRVARALANSQKSLARAAYLAGRILDYSGRGLWKPRPIELGAFLDQHRKHLAAQAGKARFDLQVPRDLPDLEGDPEQILQVLSSLVSNASEALNGHEGTIRLSVRRVAMREEDRQVGYWAAPFGGAEALCVEVSDTGPGIPSGILGRIFDPFFTTKEMGRGLGLAAVVGILRSGEAGIQVLNVRGGGASFRLYFALRGTTGAPVEPAPASPPPDAARGAILLVDDDEDLRETLVEVLGEVLHVPVREARDGLEAVEIYRQDPGAIALVLMDATMPRLGGGEAFEAIKQINPAARAILISGFSQRMGQEEVRRHGFSAFLKKPFSLADLKQAIDVALTG